MYIVTGLLILVFIVYSVFIYLRYGILPSFSDSYYKLKEDKRLGKHGKLLFLTFCLSLGGLMLAISSMYYEYKAVGFLFASGAGFIFTGIASAFKKSLTNIVHYIGATIGIGAAFTALWLIGDLWPLTTSFMFFVGIFLMLKLDNIIYWSQWLAFALISYGLLILPQ